MFFRMVYKSGKIFLLFCHNARVWRTDGRTDRRTEFSSLDRVCIARSAVKTYTFSIKIRFSLLKPMFTPNHWHHIVVCYQATCVWYSDNQAN